MYSYLYGNTQWKKEFEPRCPNWHFNVCKRAVGGNYYIKYVGIFHVRLSIVLLNTSTPILGKVLFAAEAYSTEVAVAHIKEIMRKDTHMCQKCLCDLMLLKLWPYYKDVIKGVDPTCE